MSRMIFIFMADIFAAGCATKQDYQIISQQQRDQVLNDHAVVVEGHVVAAKDTLKPEPLQMLFFFVPMSVTKGNSRHDAIIAVDRVLKGNVPDETIELRDYRSLTTREKALFPDVYGIHIKSIIRIGFNGHHGDQLSNLAIVPLGNTPEFDEALRQAALMRARRAASKPSTKQ